MTASNKEGLGLENMTQDDRGTGVGLKMMLLFMISGKNFKQLDWFYNK